MFAFHRNVFGPPGGVAGLSVWERNGPSGGWVAGAEAVIPMRQAGQSGACVNAPCALLFLRPSKLNNLSFVDYWTDVANFPRFYFDVRFCPTYIDLDGRGARPRWGWGHF